MRYIFLFFCLFGFKAQAQSGFSEPNVIDTFNFTITRVFSTDLDGDGDFDILASGWNAYKIFWYKNLDGQGNFGPIQMIDSNLNFTQSLRTADLDGDGDQDVLASSAGDDKVVWYKNLDGLGSFSPALVIALNAPGARHTISADIDNDGDLDVISAITNASKLVWYENIDGLGNFSAEKIIATGINGVFIINAADIDNDGFLDLVSSWSSNNYPAWFKNLDGQGTFSSQIEISNDTYGSWEVLTADIDGDGDLDVFNLEAGGELIAWYENLDGLGNFGSKQIIQDTNPPVTMQIADIDNDGDIDLVAAYLGDLKKVWFENTDGLGTFSAPKVIDNQSSISLFFKDIDNDGFDDLITSFGNSLDSLVWYKNQVYLGVGETFLQNIKVTPNPVKNGLLLAGLKEGSKISITLYDVSGKVVKTINAFVKEIDVSSLKNGLYFLEIKTKTGTIVKKIIKE